MKNNPPTTSSGKKKLKHKLIERPSVVDPKVIYMMCERCGLITDSKRETCPGKSIIMPSNLNLPSEEVTMRSLEKEIRSILESRPEEKLSPLEHELWYVDQTLDLFQQQLEEREKEDIAFITDACQLIDGFSQYAKAENDWTEWDEQTRVNLGKLLKKKYNSLETLGGRK